MSVHGPAQMTSKATSQRPHQRFPGLLRAVALIAVIAGAAGSLGSMLWVGRRNPSRILILLFVVWVLSPFVALGVANMASKHWPVLIRVTLYSVTLILTVGSLAIYGDVAFGPPRPTPAFMFIVVPFASWLIMIIVVPAAALISRRLSRRGAGA